MLIGLSNEELEKIAQALKDKGFKERENEITFGLQPLVSKQFFDLADKIFNLIPKNEKRNRLSNRL